jgi:outer membrane translocation and assembly module TamA
MNQETSLNLDLNLLNRTAYYTMFSGMIDLKYRWKRTPEIQHSISPLYLNSVSLIATTPDFDSIVDENIYIRKSFEEQFIIGTKYEFNYDNTHKIQPHNFFFLGSVRASGNLVDLFASRGKEDADRPHYMLKNTYSQYLKITTDFRYYYNGFNKSFVFRLYAGLGLPYLNSTVIPYVEQFFSGGAYSVRGFTARTLGPGSYYEEDNTFIDQSGDVKLEGNFEYRFVISKILHGALFLEAGNIWLVNEDENRPGSEFNFNTFYNELAVGTGFGLRFDFNFFVLRTDLGFPLRTAYVKDDTNWLLGSEPLLKKGLFYIAIGYPF